MEGSKIHILEELPKAGGSLDGENMPLKAMLSEVVVKWRTTLNVCGIYSDLSLRLKLIMRQY